MIHSLLIAFSLYSVLPMPRAEWTPKNMRYAMCFLPLVGLVIGGLEALWLFLGELWGLGPVLRGAAAALLPAAVSGGIHLDGLCDTCDALGSHQPREKKLAILKDSHTGAFAVIGLAVYLLALTGVLSELRWSPRAGVLLALCFPLSRILGSLLLLLLPCAREDGLARTFSDAAERCCTVILAVLGVLLLAGATVLSPVCGLVMAAALVLLFFALRRKFRREFGGVTGDLAGFSIELGELALAAVLIVLQKIPGGLLV